MLMKYKTLFSRTIRIERFRGANERLRRVRSALVGTIAHLFALEPSLVDRFFVLGLCFVVVVPAPVVLILSLGCA